jgi:hypothetical protein
MRCALALIFAIVTLGCDDTTETGSLPHPGPDARRAIDAGVIDGAIDGEPPPPIDAEPTPIDGAPLDAGNPT